MDLRTKIQGARDRRPTLWRPIGDFDDTDRVSFKLCTVESKNNKCILKGGNDT